MSKESWYQDIMPREPEKSQYPSFNALFLLLSSLFCLAFVGVFSLTLPIWGDEYFTHKVSLLPFRECIKTVLHDVHPPLFWILTHWAYSLGANIFVIRFLAFIIGLISILVISKKMSLAVKPEIRDRTMSLFFLLVLTSPFFLLFMPMARYYSLIVFLVACSLMLRLILKGGWFSIISIIVVDTLMLYTNFIAGLIIIGGNVYLLTRKKHHLSSLQHVLIWILPWLFFSPIIGYFTRAITKLSVQDVFKADFGAGLKGFAVRLLYSLHVFVSGEFIYPWQPSGIIMLLLAIYLLYRFIRYGPSELKSLLGWGVLMPALITILGSVTLFSLGMEFLPPRIAFAQPFLLLAIAIGLATIQSRKVFYPLLILFLLGNLHADYKFAKRENFLHSTYIIPWEQIISDIRFDFNARNDVIVFDDDTFMLYAEKKGLYNEGFNISSVQMPDIFTYQRIWLVFSPKDITPDHKLQDFLDSLKKAGYVEIRHEYYLEEKESARRIKEKLLGRPISQYKKELILFEKPQI